MRTGEPGTVNVSRDEIRRQLRATESAHQASLPALGSALRRAFDPDGGVSAEARGGLVGVPTSRRGFLRIGGLTVAASAFLVACGSDVSDNVAQTGSVPPKDPNPLEVETGDELNMTLLLTASSVEALAIATYDAVLDGGLLDSADLDAVVELFRDQHADHLGLLSATVRDLGGTPYEEPNPYLDVNVVQPAVADLADTDPAEVPTDVLNIAYALENAAAQTYRQAAGLLDTIELRQAIMSIGAVEARHVAVILGALDEDQVPFPFLPVGAAVPGDSYITEDGPVTEVTTTTTTTVDPDQPGELDFGDDQTTVEPG